MRVILICKHGYTSPGRRRQIAPAFRLAAALALIASPAPADAPEIRILAAGIFRPAPVTGELPPGLRDQTLSGVDRTALPTLVTATATVPAKLCRSFGLIFTRAAPADTPLTVRVSHPPLHRPDGQAGSVDRFEIPPGAGPHYVGFTFTAAWEMVPGMWIFTLLAGDRPLARADFTVLPATEAAETGCGAVVSGIGAFRFAAGLGILRP